MSGGSYDYAFRRLEDLADDIESGAARQRAEGRLNERTTGLRRALAVRLRLIADACRAVEWVDSYDFSAGDEDEPIAAALRGHR